VRTSRTLDNLSITPATSSTPGLKMDKNIFGFIWRYSKREQITVLLITLLSFPFLYLSLEVPKTIINEALTGTDFPKQILGFDVSQIEFLLSLCTAFLLLILINGVFKLRINIYKGTIAERLMRRLRYQLIARILRFPTEHFQRVSQGDLIPMVTAEVEPLGGLMGDAVASPVLQCGQMFTILLFLFVQNPLLGIAGIALIPVQAYLIPKLQRRVNLLHREKVRRIRSLSNKIGETVSAVDDIRINDAAAYVMSDYSQQLGTIFRIRLEIFNKKYSMKFINNTMNQITPFFFYSVGGYLVITGDLTVGALVAALSAYKDLTSPWRNLLTYYNQVQDSSIRYEAIVEQFAPRGLKSEGERPQGISRLDGSIEAVNVSWQDENGIRELQNVNFSLPAGSHIAFTGTDDIGRNILAQLLTHTLDPTSGRLLVGGRDYASLADSVSGARIAYVGLENYIFNGTIAENVQFGLYRKPPELANPTAEQLHYIEEARASGNSPHSFDASWIDYDTAGYRDHEELVDWWLRVLRAVGSEAQLFEHQLGGRLDAIRRPDLATRLLQARAAMDEKLETDEYRGLVHRFDSQRYNPSASVAENILFGIASDDRLSAHNLGSHPYMLRALDACELRETFGQLSLQIADAILEMFSDAASGHPFFERFEFVDEEMVPRLKLIHARAARDETKLDDDDRKLFLALPYRLIPERHRLGLIDTSLQQQLLKVRRWFADNLPDDIKNEVISFDPGQYHSQLSIFDNVVFGRVAFSQAGAEEKIRTLVIDLLDELGMRDEIILLVEDRQTGPGGSLLPIQARERITLARALVKRPDVLICNRALASLPADQRNETVGKLRELLPLSTLIWMDRDIPSGEEFDQIFEIEAGRIEPVGSDRLAPVASEQQPPHSDTQSELHALARVPIFAGLPPASLKLLALTALRRDYAAGDLLYSRDGPADGAYIVLSGELEVLGTIGGSELVTSIQPGEITGDIAVIAKVPYKATVRARIPTTALFIAADALREMIENDVGVASGMLQNVGLRVVQLVESLETA
jgi:putative ABC transport system ATP-binding protein